MICGKCANNYATVHFTEVANGVNREVHLCKVCARLEGPGAPLPPYARSILARLGADPGDPGTVEPPGPQAPKGKK